MVREKKLTEEMDEFREKLNSIEKAVGEKKFKKQKLNKNKLKKGYVVVQLFKDNNYVNFRKLKIIDGNIHLGPKDEDTYHLADTEYIGMIDAKTPLIMLPEWSNEPITKEVLTRTVEANKSTIKPQKQIIHLMEDARLAEQIKPKTKMGGIIIILVVGVGIYLLGKSLGWFGS